MKPFRLISTVLACLLITACMSSIARHPAKVIHEHAHSGGSTLSFSGDSTIAASGGWSGYIRLWQMPDGKHVRKWNAHTGSVNGIQFLDADRKIISGGYDGRIVEWDINGKELRSTTTPSPIRHLIASEKHDRIITGHEDGAVRQWRLNDFKLINETKKHTSAIRAVASHYDTNWVASSGHDGEVWLWRPDHEPKLLQEPGSDARTLVFSPDGKQLYGGAWFHLYRWNLPDGTIHKLETDHIGIINEIRFSPDGDYIASISRQTDSAVLFLNPDNGKTLRHFQKHELCGVAIAVSPNGRFISTTSDDASVRFYDLQDQVAEN